MNAPLRELLALPGSAICRLPGNLMEWGVFSNPAEIIVASTLSEVIPAITAAEKFVAGGGYAVGTLAYEASAAFDTAFPTPLPHDFPLAWFALYAAPPQKLAMPFTSEPPETELPQFSPLIDYPTYLQGFERIQRRIFDGEVYQVNFTCRLGAASLAWPEALFLRLCHSHPMPYAAYLNAGDFQLISLSPELFLAKTGNDLSSVPMKGTAPRGLSAAADQSAATELAQDVKNRAENLMIIDMVRNDFGRVCQPGSIIADPIFHVDTYPTVHQMVSVLHGKLAPTVPLTAVLQATFPPASITGAPKISAVKIIAEVESAPRHIYTGTIGCMTPDGNYCFNVAIRTILNRHAGAELGVGGGLVADSKPESEWRELLLKGSFATHQLPNFYLLETICWERKKGFKYWPEHLARAAESAKYFARPFNLAEIQRAADNLQAKLAADNSDSFRVRLTIAPDGTPHFQALPLNAWNQDGVKIIIATEPTDANNLFLYHKTTIREFYDRIYRQYSDQGYDEVIFCNRDGMITEGAISNIFVKLNGEWLTPPISAGLLPGIWRAKMIIKLNARETNITPAQLCAAENLLIGNSVRGTATVFSTALG